MAVFINRTGWLTLVLAVLLFLAWATTGAQEPSGMDEARKALAIGSIQNRDRMSDQDPMKANLTMNRIASTATAGWISFQRPLTSLIAA